MDVLTCGFIVADLILADLPFIPQPGHIIYTNKGIKLRTGGHPTNISIDLMQMGAGKEKIGIAGKVGKDAFGDYIENYLRSKGVMTFLERSDISDTSKCVVQVVIGQDRRCILEPGANTELSFEFVKSIILEKRPRIFYNAGGILGDYDLKTREVFKISRSISSLNIFDFISPYGKDWSYVIDALEYTDVVHCNDIELTLMTGKDDIREGALKMADFGAKLVIISLGDKGLHAYFKRDRLWIQQDAFKVDVVDPTGAGDALVAGIIFRSLSHGIREGKGIDDIDVDNLTKVLLYGQASGAACVTEIGTTPGVIMKNIDNILMEQGDRVLSNTQLTYVN